jgi:hypothetical protein
MITFKQQIILEELRIALPQMLESFDLEIPRSPEFQKSIDVAIRVQAIVDEISNQELRPRSVPRETSYHEDLIALWSRKYTPDRDRDGNIIAPF